MDRAVRLYYRDQLREARAAALRDAEGYQEILFALERLGSHLNPKGFGLRDYEEEIVKLAEQSPMAFRIPGDLPGWHSPFRAKYTILRDARNSALHQGAVARHLAVIAVEVSLVLEEAIMNSHQTVGDYMVKNPLCAFLWQPLSFIRQSMLANSYSYLPVPVDVSGETVWKLISDFELARYLRGGASKTERHERLARSLSDAVRRADGVGLIDAQSVGPQENIEAALRASSGLPVVVTSPRGNDIMGILTPFDLL